LRNVYTSSTILTGWYHFIWRGHVYGNLISPAKKKHLIKSSCKVHDFLLDLNQKRRIFIQISSTKFNVNPPSGSSIGTWGQTDGWKDRLTLATPLVEDGAYLGRCTVADKNKNYLGLHDICPIFSPDFNQIRIFVCFLLGNSPVSEFYMPTFRNTLFHPHKQVGVKNELGLRNVGVFYGERFGSKIAWTKPFPV
jgi:hypothetical protein